MTALQVLALRREQVLLSCELQRGTLGLQLAVIERRPAMRGTAALLSAARFVRSIL